MTGPSISLPRTRRKGERGVALLMVVTAIALLTAVAVEFSYHSRIEARMAANARDQLRAYYLARSAVTIGRLVLHFQRQVDGIQLPDLSSILGPLMGGGAGGAPGGAGAANPLAGAALGGLPGAGGSLHLRLWDIIPVNSGTLQLFIGPSTQSLDILPLTPSGATDGGPIGLIGPKGFGDHQAPLTAPTRAFGDFDGTFVAQIDDEESKINVNALNQLSTLSAATTTEMLALMHWNDQKYDFLFQDDDQHRQVKREEVLQNLHDWEDADSTTSVFNPQALATFSDPYQQGFGDEDEFYQRQDPRYRAKNAPFDTVDELFQVHGVTDRFMAAFGKRLTVYSPPNALLNVNTNDPTQQLTNILVALDTQRFPDIVQQLLGNPILLQTVLTEVQLLRSFSFLGMSVQSFVQVLTANKLPVRPELSQANGPHAFLGDQSQTFTIHAEGQVGDVTSRITAVVRYDDNLGKLLYWRED
jgi:general secretion pathway protein K